MTLGLSCAEFPLPAELTQCWQCWPKVGRALNLILVKVGIQEVESWQVLDLDKSWQAWKGCWKALPRFESWSLQHGFETRGLRRQMANRLGPTEEVNSKLEHIQVSCKLYVAYWEGYWQTVLANWEGKWQTVWGLLRRWTANLSILRWVANCLRPTEKAIGKLSKPIEKANGKPFGAYRGGERQTWAYPGELQAICSLLGGYRQAV